MHEITTPRRRNWLTQNLGGTRRRLLTTLAIGAVGVGIATPAVSHSLTVSRDASGAVEVNAAATKPVMLTSAGNAAKPTGRYMTSEEAATAHANGTERSRVDRELACQGITLYFSSAEQEAAYTATAGPRHDQEVMQDMKNHPADPCTYFRGHEIAIR